jgi:hypothetical protein
VREREDERWIERGALQQRAGIQLV